MARTNWVSEIQATRPEESTRARAARGARRTSHDQMRCPSAMKKKVANSTMKKPAKTWVSVVPTSVIRVTTWPSLVWSVIMCCASLMQRSIWESLAFSGPSSSHTRICPSPFDRLVGQVGGAVGDLLAHEGERGADGGQPADQHHAARRRREAAAAGQEVDEQARRGR